MKTLLSIVAIALGAVAIYFMYSYAIKNQPQLKFSHSNNNTAMPNESAVVASYIKEALKKEQNRTANTKEHKKLTIESVLVNNKNTNEQKEKNETNKSPKKLFKDIASNSTNSADSSIEDEKISEENITLEGTVIPTVVEEKKVLTKEQEEMLNAKNAPIKQRFETLKAKYGDPIYIRIFKKPKELEVWIKPKESKNYKLLKIYKICTYSGGLGPKLKEGDGISPEGFYSVDYGALNPNSKFHLSFNLGFPNEYDINHGRTGSYLMVHGSCVSTGCYAMGNKNIEEIYKLVKEALLTSQSEVMVHIFPFRFTKENLAKYRNNRWFSFWLNLKEGYDAFNQTHIPPKVAVEDLKYIITKSNK